MKYETSAVEAKEEIGLYGRSIPNPTTSPVSVLAVEQGYPWHMFRSMPKASQGSLFPGYAAKLFSM
ncbi:MAG: hypothetical protein QUS11_00810 [Candidatus Fermentibacter sp.]|nr:hypothetical protein [Candidatus Fermentibacter sp.]